MSEEVFEYVDFSRSPVFGEKLGYLDEELQRYKTAYSSGDLRRDSIIFDDQENPSVKVNHEWDLESCFLLKGTFIGTFKHRALWEEEELMTIDEKYRYEMWGLLKFGAAESWTKMFVFELEGREFVKCLEFWKDGTCICSHESSLLGYDDFDPEEHDQDDGIFVYDPTIGEVVGDRRLEIEGTVPQFGAHVFTPTQVSLP